MRNLNAEEIFDVVPVLAMELAPGMDIRVPGLGPISLAHVSMDEGKVSVTPALYDEEVSFPVASFDPAATVDVFV